MDLFKTVKCIFCLMKCSKYLYYIKKAVCFASIGLAAVTAICLLKDKKTMLRKFLVK